MKTLYVCSLAVLTAIFVFPAVLSAQIIPPPDCCPPVGFSAQGGLPTFDIAVNPDLQLEVVVNQQLPENRGIVRMAALGGTLETAYKPYVPGVSFRR